MTESNGGLDDRISERFGKAPSITIIELSEGSIRNIKVIPNPGVLAKSGSGIKAAQKLAEEQVEAVVAGNFGPNALGILRTLNIEPITFSGMRVKDAINDVIKYVRD